MEAKLNPAQHEAVHTLSGPLLVLAGAGTGKTRVVTYRIARLIQYRIQPDRILAVTFTNKAAKEMRERATALLGKRLPKKPLVCTFHSLCVKILRVHITKLGYPETFAIYDRGDQQGIAKEALRTIKVPDATIRPGDLLSAISRWKCGSIRPAQAIAAATETVEHLAASAYRHYQRILKNQGAVDFDDLLLLTEDLFAESDEARHDIARRFDHLLVDEYQDTNASQYRIIKAMAEGHRNLCVVGDDDQAIYGWRGAEVTHILRFKRDWPDAKVVMLEENYRSTAPILEFANRLIRHNSDRHNKVLRTPLAEGLPPRILQLGDERLEAKHIVGEIERAVKEGAVAGDFAILFRTNEQPRVFEEELRHAHLPYVLLGAQSFFDRTDVKNLIAYLRMLVRPQDDPSLLRILNFPARGIGDTTLNSIKEMSVVQGRRIWDTLPEAATAGKFTSAAVTAIGKFRTLIERHQAMLHGRPASTVLRSLIDEIGYRHELERTVAEIAERDKRWNSVEELVNALAEYEDRCAEENETPRLTTFLDEMTLEGRDSSDDKKDKIERNAVKLLTLHSAKGLEFPYVYMVGLEEGILPHKRSVEQETVDEERRLCYVGVTRARQRLTLSFAATRFKWGAPRPTICSRFLFELDGRAMPARHLDGPKQSFPTRSKSGRSGKSVSAKSEAKGRTAKSGGTKPGGSKPRNAKK